MRTSRGGHQARQGNPTDAPSNAYQLLGGGWSLSIDPTQDCLTDLEATRLVITPDYVGPPRRRDDRRSDSDQPASPAEAEVVQPASAGPSGKGSDRRRPTAQRPPLRPYHLVVAVLLTVVLVVPLTLVAAHVL